MNITGDLQRQSVLISVPMPRFKTNNSKLRQLIFSLMRYTGKRVVAQRYRLITICL